jgi:hypothetical protein
MTRDEWLTSTNPGGMLVFATHRRVPDRKLLLFAVACMRRQEQYLGGEHLAGMSRVTEVAERLADGLATKTELRDAHAALEHLFGYGHTNGDGFTTALWATHAGGNWAGKAAKTAAQAAGTNDAAALLTTDMIATVLEQQKHAELLRCIVGDPFAKPLASSPYSLNCGSVRSLAEGIYQDHAFDRLPIFADALEDAGCTEPDVLAHCREPGPHARGCWVVDWILGKHCDARQEAD